MAARIHPAGTFGAAVSYSGVAGGVAAAAAAAVVGDDRLDNLWTFPPRLEGPIEEVDDVGVEGHNRLRNHRHNLKK